MAFDYFAVHEAVLAVVSVAIQMGGGDVYTVAVIGKTFGIKVDGVGEHGGAALFFHEGYCVFDGAGLAVREV